MTDTSNAENDALLTLYADAAALHGRATLEGDHRAANKAYAEVARTYGALKARGPEAQERLLELLDHIDSGVRVWAASHALEFASAKGERALEILAKAGGVTGLTAATTLSTWRSGALRF